MSGHKLAVIAAHIHAGMPRKKAMGTGVKMRFGLVAIAAMGLASCVNLDTAKPPTSLLTLTPITELVAGKEVSGTPDIAIQIGEFEAAAKLNITRVPVQVDATEITYLQDAVWVEKPARMFRRLLAETIRAGSQAYVIDSDDPAITTTRQLRGTMREFGYDVRRSAVIVRFDMVGVGLDGAVRMRRFESIQTGVSPQAGPVGRALNRGANDVAGQISDWIFAVTP